MLTAYIEMLELTHKDTQDAIREVICMMEQLDTELARTEEVEQVDAFDSAVLTNDPALTITTRMKSELMMMSKITPALSIDINCSKKKLDSAVYWSVQVVCAEHQVCSHSLSPFNCPSNEYKTEQMGGGSMH